MTRSFFRFVWVLVVAVSFPSLAAAQSVEEFQADRPGATTGPGVLPRGRVQWETGFASERSALEGPWERTWTVNTSLVRVGFSDFAELRLEGEYIIHTVNDVRSHGWDNLSFGVKGKLLEGEKWIPSISLMANALLPGKNYSPFMSEEWGGRMALLCENTVTSWFTIGYEADLIWEGEEVEPDVFFGICLGFAPWKRFSFFVEEFNRSTANGLRNWMEFSLAFQLAPRVQLDIATDISLNDTKKYSIFMLGLIWQITKR